MPDVDYLIFKKTLGALRPADDAAAQALQKIPMDKEVAIKIKRPRNIRHHRLFFALLKIVFENQEVYKSEAALLAAIKIATGHCTPIVLTDGTRAFIPSSISFAAMDQTQFDAFYERVCTLVCAKIIPNLSREDLQAEIMTMVS